VAGRATGTAATAAASQPVPNKEHRLSAGALLGELSAKHQLQCQDESACKLSAGFVLIFRGAAVAPRVSEALWYASRVQRVAAVGTCQQSRTCQLSH
jgi:hypothetical protein